MPIEITKRWSDDRLLKSATGWQAHEGYDASGPAAELADKLAVLAALASIFGIDINTPHSANANLKVKDIDVGPGLMLRRLTVIYAFPPRGTWDQNLDPLDDPAEIFPQFGLTSEPVSLSDDGFPIINSARDAYQPAPTNEFPSIIVNYTKYRAIFPLTTAIALMNTTNLTAFNLPGLGTIQPGEGWLQYITAAEPYTAQSPYVRVLTVIELRSAAGLPTGVSPFDFRLIDWGFRVYGPNPNPPPASAPVKIVDSQGNEISTEVLLGGNGVPVVSGFWAGSVGTPSAVLGDPPGAIVEQTNDAAFLYYKKKRGVEWGPSGFDLAPLLT